MEKVYIGDSVYAVFDGYHIILTTENGYGPSNTIALEDTVFNSLLKYAERVYGGEFVFKKDEGQVEQEEI